MGLCDKPVANPNLQMGAGASQKIFFFGADAGCVSRFLFLKFGIWRAREKPCPVVRDN